jgi:predicted membrane protein
VASLIAFISFIGWPLGFLISFAFGTFCFAGSIYVAQFLGCYIIRVLNMGKKPLSFVGLLLGIIILSLLVLIPFVGWIVCILVMASGLGSLVLSLKIFSDNKQSQPASGESLPNE